MMVGRRCGGFLMERLKRVRMGVIWKKDRRKDGADVVVNKASKYVDN
jgi:hypothetical protein